MSNAYDWGGNTPGMGTADPNLLQRIWGYIARPTEAAPMTGPAGPTTPSGSITSAVSPPANPYPLPPPRPADLGGGAAATIPPAATALAPPAAAPAAAPPSSMFTTIDAPNANPGTGGGMLGGALGRNQITALNLGGMFGGGAPAAAAPAKTRVTIPASATAEVPPDTVSKAPWDYGPTQKKVGWSKRKYGPDVTDPAGYHSGYY